MPTPSPNPAPPNLLPSNHQQLLQPPSQRAYPFSRQSQTITAGEQSRGHNKPQTLSGIPLQKKHTPSLRIVKKKPQHRPGIKPSPQQSAIASRTPNPHPTS